MKLVSRSFNEAEMIPGDFAFAIADPEYRVALGKNLNPHLFWSEVPAGTQSFVVICHDPDVPGIADDVNQIDRTVSASLPRIDFFHWTLVDVPSSTNEIKAGEFSSEVTPRGKPGPASLYGTRQGVNDFMLWFASDNDMRGEYYGYDGPCPPWNDELPHRYIFTVYALSIDRLPVEGKFTGQQVLVAMQGHILDQACLTGIYTLNPAVRL